MHGHSGPQLTAVERVTNPYGRCLIDRLAIRNASGGAGKARPDSLGRWT